MSDCLGIFFFLNAVKLQKMQLQTFTGVWDQNDGNNGICDSDTLRMGLFVATIFKLWISIMASGILGFVPSDDFNGCITKSSINTCWLTADALSRNSSVKASW